MAWKFDPQTKLKFRRFRQIRRGYYSLIFLSIAVLLAIFAELWVNSRALVVRYDNQWFFPTYGSFLPGSTFGLGYEHETNYRDLKKRFAAEQSGNNFVILPLVPYNPFENTLHDGRYPPFPPSWTERHYLGTDTIGRDIAARLVYGFRTAFFFSLLLMLCIFGSGVVIGCAMGYWGGWFDLLFQRLIEIWTNFPTLYAVIIISSIMIPNFYVLISVLVLLSWPQMTWQMRAITYKERSREYCQAAQAIGVSHWRIILKHILPNCLFVLLTYAPFVLASGITVLTTLDFLGFGLPAPTPSWGELISQGSQNLQDPWILLSVVTAMSLVLVLVNFVGEAVREAFDPKRFSYFE